MTGAATQRIRELNDQARQTFTGCRVLITPGVRALGQTPDILALVQRFNGFTPDNDPCTRLTLPTQMSRRGC
jgi:hypothetical protein